MQKEKLTVLIPFRNREDNLKVFIPYFHNFMKNNFPTIIYEMVVIEQGNNNLWNKGILLNSGFLLTSGNTDYYVLHDVDQLPLSVDFYYNSKPFQLYINAFEQSNKGILLNPLKDEYHYMNKGGVIKINKECYIKANGHSVNYWGWGFEDDDFNARLNFNNIGLWRKNARTFDNGYFVSLNAKSKRYKENEHYNISHEYVKRVINGEIDTKSEGLNTTKFKLLETIINNDYIKYIIDFDTKN